MSDLTQLLQKLDIDDGVSAYQEIEHVTSQNLPKDLKPYVISLLKQDKYEAALQAVNKHSPQTKGINLDIEKAYIFYKLNRRKDFEQLLSTMNTSELSGFESRGLDHIKAQFCYRNGELDKSFEIYQTLMTNEGSTMDDLTELEINQTCVSTHSDENKQGSVENIDSYDLALNRSILAATCGNYSRSRKLAQQACKLSQEKDELSMAEFQVAYLSNNAKDKRAILQKIMQKHDGGLLFQSLIKNNSQSIDSNAFSTVLTNFPLVLSKLDPSTINVLKSRSKYSERQNELISSNVLLLRLFSNSSIGETTVGSSSSPMQYALGKYKKLVADIVMEPFSTQSKKLYHYVVKSISSHETSSLQNIAVLLLAAQLQIQTKQFDNAIRLLVEYLGKFESTMALDHVSVLQTVLLKLYKLTNRKKNRVDLLEKITTNEQFLASLDKENGKFKEFAEYLAYDFLELGFNDKFEGLINRIPGLSQIHAADSPSSFNNKKFQTSCDVNKLIKLGVDPFINKSKIAKTNKTTNSTTTTTTTTTTKQNKVVKKKLRKNSYKKLPKNYDPSHVPDPERWLPLKDRTSTMMKKPARKQRKLIAEGKTTQGGGLINKKLARKLDISKKNTSTDNNKKQSSNSNKSKSNKKKTNSRK